MYARITLPLIDGYTADVSPRSESAQLRLVFAQADARLHMWDESFAADLTEQDTRYLSSSVRGEQPAEWLRRARREYPESL